MQEDRQAPVRQTKIIGMNSCMSKADSLPFVSPVDRSPYMSSELTGLQSPVAREWMLTQLCFPVVPPGVGGGCCWNNLVFAWTYQLDI